MYSPFQIVKPAPWYFLYEYFPPMHSALDTYSSPVLLLSNFHLVCSTTGDYSLFLEHFYHVLQRQQDSQGTQRRRKEKISLDYLPTNQPKPDHAAKIGGLGATDDDIVRIKKEVHQYKTDLKEHATIAFRRSFRFRQGRKVCSLRRAMQELWQ